MAVSEAVRAYYAEHILGKSARGTPPPNFVPLSVPHTGFATVEGCRGGGKNVLEIALVGKDGAVTEVRAGCGLCNPAMLAAADIIVDWARGRSMVEILAFPVLETEALAPFWTRLGGPGRPDDAREKFQYAVLAVQRAVRDHRGEADPEVPSIDEPTDKDWDDPS